MATQSLEEAFHATGETVIDDAYWNRFLAELAARFAGLESIKISWDEVSRQGIDVALARINETIGPAAERIRSLSTLGFLVASSETPATLGDGLVLDLVVVEGTARDLFTPSPFLILQRTLTADDYAVAKLRTYDQETGALQVEVVTFAGDPGPHSDWTIGALAGSTLAQLLLLGQGQAAQATTQGLRDATGVDRAAVATDRAAVQVMRDDVAAMAAGATGAAGFDARLDALETDPHFGGTPLAGTFAAIGPAGTTKGFQLRTDALNRWTINSNSVAESGGNAGSDFGVNRFDDAGAYLDSPLTISRATGVANFLKVPTVAGVAVATEIDLWFNT